MNSNSNTGRTDERVDSNRLSEPTGTSVDDAKILGDIDTDDSIGVFGRSTGAGTTIGVRGEADSESGYGLYTPDDVGVGGVLETDTIRGAITDGQSLTDIAGPGLEIDNGVLTATGSGSSYWESTDDTLEPSGDETGISVQDVETDRLLDGGSGTLSFDATLDVDDHDIVDSETTVWDSSAEHIPQDRLEHDSVTISAGSGLSDGGSVSLGESTTLDVDTESLAGNGLDTGNDNDLMIESNSIGTTELETDFSDLATLFGDPVTVGGDLRSASDSGLTISTDGESPILRLGTPTSATFETAGGNIVGGHPDNSVDDDAAGVVISGGGGDSGSENSVDDDYGTIGGGKNNTVKGQNSTIAGGQINNVDSFSGTIGGGEHNDATGNNHVTVGGGGYNEASGNLSTIAGGHQCTAEGQGATVGGGTWNAANGDYATTAGGDNNFARGEHATVPGGRNNTADGDDSFAAGREAKAEHDGAIVFGDSSSTEVTSESSDEARFQMEIVAEAGVSDQSATATKANIEPVDTERILAGVNSLEVSTWEYKDTDRTHIGPMAEDFEAAFGVGSRDSINSIDRGGVALAAIQQLSAQVDEKDQRIDELEQKNRELEQRLEALEHEITAQDPTDNN